MAQLATLEAAFRIARSKKDRLIQVYKDLSDHASMIGHAFVPIVLEKSTAKKIKEAANALLAELKAAEG